MVKTVIIGDTHGLSLWKDIVNQSNPDRVVFVGDYFDSFDIKFEYQLTNFLDILEFKKSSGKDVILLIGNHDFHYMPFTQEYYSGHQRNNHYIIQNVLMDNINHLSMCYRIDDYLMSHAGVSITWLSNCYNKMHNQILTDYNNVDFIVNDIWKYKPQLFRFTGYDPYGDSEESSPIWIRPKSLQRANKHSLKNEYIQIVGHTQHRNIDVKGATTGGRYYYVDTLQSSKEYIILEDGKLSVQTIN
jgi:UDP-2,3-diacylglucosamine pyrophosphatase LpxH